MKKLILFSMLVVFACSSDDDNNNDTVIDIDGNAYNYLTYGNQTWTVDNARMFTYSDGTPIPQVTDPIEWANLNTGAWCYYDNDPEKGVLYNLMAVLGVHDQASISRSYLRKNIAPKGWHVPTEAEWTTLKEYLIANGYNYDGTTVENKIAKSMASTSGWEGSTNLGAIGNEQRLNNRSGFNAFPYGARSYIGEFTGEGLYALFWCFPERPILTKPRYGLSNNFSYFQNFSNNEFEHGFSLRFVKD